MSSIFATLAETVTFSQAAAGDFDLSALIRRGSEFEQASGGAMLMVEVMAADFSADSRVLPAKGDRLTYGGVGYVISDQVVETQVASYRLLARRSG